MARITPRTLKGFRDIFRRSDDSSRAAFRRDGPSRLPVVWFQPDRHAGFGVSGGLLAGKGGEGVGQAAYKFQDHGGRWVGLFDLTVPLAWFAAPVHRRARHAAERYHIAAVWRGVRIRRGYREFMVRLRHDRHRSVAPTLNSAGDHDLLQRHRGFDAFTIRLNNRMVLAGLLERLDFAGRATPISALDKLGKIGPAG